MKKHIYFGVFDGRGWPLPEQLQRYFLAPPGQRWPFDGGNDSWGNSGGGGTRSSFDAGSRGSFGGSGGGSFGGGGGGGGGGHSRGRN